MTTCRKCGRDIGSGELCRTCRLDVAWPVDPDNKGWRLVTVGDRTIARIDLNGHQGRKLRAYYKSEAVYSVAWGEGADLHDAIDQILDRYEGEEEEADG